MNIFFNGKYSIKKQWEMVWDEAIERYQDTLPRGPEKHSHALEQVSLIIDITETCGYQVLFAHWRDVRIGVLEECMMSYECVCDVNPQSSLVLCSRCLNCGAMNLSRYRAGTGIKLLASFSVPLHSLDA